MKRKPTVFMTLTIEKLVLNMEAAQDAFFEDAALVGLSTPLPGYQVCQMLNEAFCLNFERDPELDILIYNEDGLIQQYYSVYQCLVPLCNDRYLLYKLRSGADSLLPELKNLDYLWLVQGLCPQTLAETFAQELKRLPAIRRTQVVEQVHISNLGMLLV